MSEGGARRGEGEVTEAVGGRVGSDGGGEPASERVCVLEYVYSKAAKFENACFSVCSGSRCQLRRRFQELETNLKTAVVYMLRDKR